VYESSGASITSSDVVSNFRRPKNPWICRLCPDDDSVMAEFAEGEAQIVTARFSFEDVETNFWRRPKNPWICRLCPDDDSVTVAGIDTHKMFEDKFCDNIRASGSLNLAGVSGCSISYLEKVVDSMELVDDACDSNETLDAQVVVNGIVKDLTEEELKMIATSTKSAYNKAFMSTKSMGLGYLDTTAAEIVNGNGMVNMKIAPLCPHNKRKNDEPASDNNAKDMQKAFEDAVCTNLQGSGMASFAKASGCSFRFVNSPSKSGDSKMDVE
jgi:hypothetical protein